MSGLIWSGRVSSGVEKLYYTLVSCVLEWFGDVMCSCLVISDLECCSLGKSGVEWCGHVMSGIIRSLVSIALE